MASIKSVKRRKRQKNRKGRRRYHRPSNVRAVATSFWERIDHITTLDRDRASLISSLLEGIEHQLTGLTRVAQPHGRNLREWVARAIETSFDLRAKMLKVLRKWHSALDTIVHHTGKGALHEVYQATGRGHLRVA